MSTVYLATCNRCGFEWRFADSYPNYWYRLDNGYEIMMNLVSAWCFICNKFTQAENLIASSIIEDAGRHSNDEVLCRRYIWERYGKLDYTISSWLGRVEKTGVDYLESKDIPYAKRLKIQAEWRRARQAPPKCRACGGSELDFGTSQEDDEPTFIHQRCGGTCRIDVSGLALVLDWYYYSAEGDALDE